MLRSSAYEGLPPLSKALVKLLIDAVTVDGLVNGEIDMSGAQLMAALQTQSWKLFYKAVNAAVEAADGMPEVHEIVEAHKRAYVDGLVTLARATGAANPTLLGNQIAVLYEGAAALSTSLNEPEPWTHARKAVQTLVDAAVKRASA